MGCGTSAPTTDAATDAPAPSDSVTPDSATPTDAAPSDSATPADASVEDVGAADAGAPADAGGSADAGPAPEGEVLVNNLSPWDIAVGGGFVYIAEANNIRRVPVGGGAPTMVWTTGSNSVATQGVAADAMRVAWTIRNANSTVSGGVYACPHTGCPTNPMNLNNAESTQQITIDGPAIAWTSGSLHRVFWNLGPGAGGVVSPGSNIERTSPTSVDIDDGEVFWVNAGLAIAMRPGTVLRCPLAMGACTPTQLTNTVGNPSRIAVRGADVFVMSQTGLFRMGRDGSGMTRLAAGSSGSGKLVTDGTHLYWNAGSSILRCAVAACAPTAIAQIVTGEGLAGMDIDGEYLYFGTADFAHRVGSVRRVRR